MFELEKAIEQWRADLRQAGIHDRKTTEELESHLRDDIKALGTEMRLELAFELATRRLGKPEELRREFAKAEWRFASLAWRVLMAFIAGFSVYAAIFFAEVIPSDVGEERARMIVSMGILTAAALIAAALPGFLPEMRSLRWRGVFTWAPMVLIAAIVITIGKAGSIVLGTNESEVIRGVFVLCGVCLILLSVSFGQLCRGHSAKAAD